MSRLNAPKNTGRNEMNRLVTIAKQEGEPDQYTGKRQWLRFTEGMLLDVVADLRRPDEIWPVSMHNVCLGGFGFWAKRAIERHKDILIRAFTADNSAPWIRARVTHCTSGIRGHLIGVEAES